jgi:predicted lactoylglutathione lyase
MKHIIKGTEKENSFSYDSSSIIRRLFLGIVFNIGPSYQRMKTYLLVMQDAIAIMLSKDEQRKKTLETQPSMA